MSDTGMWDVELVEAEELRSYRLRQPSDEELMAMLLEVREYQDSRFRAMYPEYARRWDEFARKLRG